MRIYSTIFITIILFFSTNIFAEVTIKKDSVNDELVFIIENKYFKSVLAPTVARLPLSYYYKPTKTEIFRQPVKIKSGHEIFHSFGGIIDAFPAVDSFKPDDKGLLWRLPWENNITKGDNFVKYTGTTMVKYNDPISGVPAKFLFKKSVTAFADSSKLKMDYQIKNIGDNEGKFMFTAHARMGLGGSPDKKAFFQAPGNKCLYFYGNLPEFKDQKSRTWLKWPLREVTETPSEKLKNNYIFVYLPSDCCVLSDEKSKTAVRFECGKVKIGAHFQKMKIGVFRSKYHYVIEPSLTYYMEFLSWNKPDATIKLKPNELCVFTILISCNHTDVKSVKEKKD